jgi:hypothetical protein
VTIERIIELIWQDLSASDAAKKLGTDYLTMAAFIRLNSIHRTYSNMRQAEIQRAFHRVFGSLDSIPPLPPIPVKSTRGKKQ